MTDGDALGTYLRSRRDQVKPEEIGLPASARRRVPGLRREEVAMLAGISAEYYLRLEQGRDLHPSPQVLEHLARVLMLDEHERAYLMQLARPVRRRATRRAPERVAPGVRQLVMTRTDTPAFVQGRYLDVLVANPLATALSPSYRVGLNLLREAFLNPQVRALHEDWEGASGSIVASLRALAGPEAYDQRLAELVGELSVRSEEFRRLWARHDVRPRLSGVSWLNHPQLGRLQLNYEKFVIHASDGQLLVVYHAAPGSEAARNLALLTHLVESAEPASAAPAPAEAVPETRR